MQHRAIALELLLAFKRHGIRLAMDDFGTGYSSLSCLQEYPFDVLKVDRALTENVGRGRGYSALLHAVMTLADNLGLDVVAEGIEQMEQLVLLQALGCQYGQGYLLAWPLDVRAFEAWMADPAAQCIEAA
jgi:EAL domain-containing protein (putative c-di-GMP-specific phosphodiesterase class I)